MTAPTATRTLVGLITGLPSAIGPYGRGTTTEPSAVVAGYAHTLAADSGSKDFATEATALISNRIGTNFGSTTGIVVIQHHRTLFTFSGVIVGINELVIQFADESARTHTIPHTNLVAVGID